MTHSIRKAFTIVLAFILSFILFIRIPPSSVLAASFNVSRFDDPVPGSCSPGDCSLREAILAANASLGADTIDLPAGTYTLSISGKNEDSNLTGDLDILDALTINGLSTGATITAAGGWDDRIIDSPIAGFTISLTGLTIAGGNLSSGGGGGIRSVAALTMINCFIQDNQAFEAAGMETSDSLFMVSTIVRRNASGSTGGGLTMFGPSIIELSTITGNSASTSGGGIYYGGSLLQLIGSTISGNSAAWYGGGIEMLGTTISINGSTISDNTSFGTGGIDSYGTLDINNSTISGNKSTMGLAGGILEANGFTGNMNNSTVAFNETSYFGGTGGIYVDPGATFTILNSIIAKNHNLATYSQDCKGTLVANDYNLVQDVTACNLTTGTHNLTGLDPRLSILGSHGGATFTHALMVGSPALDTANPLPPGSGGLACLVNDQASQIRPIGGACDMGAFEGIRYLVFGPLVIK